MPLFNVPLNAPGQSSLQGQRAGQDFVKGIEQIKSQREQRRALKQATDEQQKDIDSGLTELQRQNKISAEELEQIKLEGLSTIYKENPEVATQLAQSGVYADLAKRSNDLSLSQNEALYDAHRKVESGIVSYAEVRQEISEIIPEGSALSLPENEEEGKAALKLFSSYAPKAIEFRRKLALTSSRPSGKAKYITGFVQLDGDRVVPARQDGLGNVEIKDKGNWRLAGEGEANFFQSPKTKPDKAPNQARKFFLDRVNSSEYNKEFDTLREGIQNAKFADELSKTALSGTGAATIAAVGGAINTTLNLLGIDSAAEGIQNAIRLKDSQLLKASSQVAIRPAIEAQGRSFSDADRDAAIRAEAGLANVQDVNRILARIAIVRHKNKLEHKFFEKQIAREILGGSKIAAEGSQLAYHQYIQDLPRAKVVDGQFTVVDDNAQLWKYWTNGRPSSFITTKGNFTLEQMKIWAKDRGQTVREYLAALSNSNNIVGVLN